LIVVESVRGEYGALGREPQALVDACRRGDRAALGQVFRAHAPAVERVLGRLLGPDADKEDLLQMTLVAAMGAFPRFRGEASVRTWLIRIAVRIVHEHLRRPERQRRVSLELVSEPSNPAPEPDRQAAARRALAHLYRHLETIGPKKRIAFVLHVFEGHPLEDVAAIMGASRMATKSRVFWARRELLRRARKDPALRELVPEDSR
jgi:RNA polymerase sigma-70 factor, ECF subfamily